MPLATIGDKVFRFRFEKRIPYSKIGSRTRFEDVLSLFVVSAIPKNHRK